MIIVWGVDDGYVGGRPDTRLEIDDEDIEGMDVAERDAYISERVREEMENFYHEYWRIEE